MGKYDIKGGNIGALGDNAHSENFTQNQQAAPVDFPNLGTLGDELQRLVEEAGRRANTPEEHNAVADLKSAAAAARAGDKKTVSDQLKSAGAWGLNIAREIGTEIAAKAISHQLFPG